MRVGHGVAADRTGDAAAEIAVHHWNLGFEFEAGRRLGDLDRGWLRLFDIAEGLAVDERDMRVVERVLHQPKAGAAPYFVELTASAESGRVRLPQVLDIGGR